jgi:hypothetical protein
MGSGLRLLLLLSTPLSGACAFSDVELEFPSAVSHVAPMGKGREVVLLTPFADRRPDPTRCGMQKNGYNADTADAVCPDNPAVWVSWLLGSELRASGFKVVQPAQVQSADPLYIEGELQQLFVEPVIKAFWITLEADIGVKLSAKTRSGLWARRSFYVKGSDSAMAATEATFQAALDQAAETLVYDMVTSIGSLVNRYPGMGSRPPALLPHPGS